MKTAICNFIILKFKWFIWLWCALTFTVFKRQFQKIILLFWLFWYLICFYLLLLLLDKIFILFNRHLALIHILFLWAHVTLVWFRWCLFDFTSRVRSIFWFWFMTEFFKWIYWSGWLVGLFNYWYHAFIRCWVDICCKLSCVLR